MFKIYSIWLLFFLIACGTDGSDFERNVVKINDQQFEILTVHELYDDFLTTRSDYFQAIFNKIENEFLEDSEFPSLLETIKADIKPDQNLKDGVEVFKTIDFESIVKSTFQRVIDELPEPTTKILFIPANPAYKEIYESYGVGIHAITVGKGKIIVSINPTIRDWQQLLPYILAHEYHHSLWMSRNFKTSELTPLEYLILEGRADAFAKRLYPETNHPFLNALSREEEKMVWNLIKSELRVRNSYINDRLMGGTELIPTGSVYSIGFNLIEAFKSNNPHVTDVELIDMEPSQILKLSKYEELINEL